MRACFEIIKLLVSSEIREVLSAHLILNKKYLQENASCSLRYGTSPS